MKKKQKKLLPGEKQAKQSLWVSTAGIILAVVPFGAFVSLILWAVSLYFLDKSEQMGYQGRKRMIRSKKKRVPARITTKICLVTALFGSIFWLYVSEFF